MAKTESEKQQDSTRKTSPETEARRRIARNPLRLYFYYLIPLIVLAVIIYYAFGAN
jgi:hypothetical protein